MDIPHAKNQKVNVLFVCLGNICRSPAAEGIMKKMVFDNHLEEDIFVDSAGTSGWHEGELPDNRMRKHGQRRGYDFCSRSRKFKYSDFETFDYIIVMDDDNYRNVKKLAKTEEDIAKIHRMTDFSNKFSHPHIPDPYYGDSSGFELVMDLLEDACENLLNKIKSEELRA
ncbi:MAG: low molecular weight protein-tyrosine-phosphatase [Bacteroidia bacterium]|nr:low molecular weight protein-tyrosine-phosphatase [Bacteroidia bacterium]